MEHQEKKIRPQTPDLWVRFPWKAQRHTRKLHVRPRALGLEVASGPASKLACGSGRLQERPGRDPAPARPPAEISGAPPPLSATTGNPAPALPRGQTLGRSRSRPAVPPLPPPSALPDASAGRGLRGPKRWVLEAAKEIDPRGSRGGLLPWCAEVRVQG